MPDHVSAGAVTSYAAVPASHPHRFTALLPVRQGTGGVDLACDACPIMRPFEFDINQSFR